MIWLGTWMKIVVLPTPIVWVITLGGHGITLSRDLILLASKHSTNARLINHEKIHIAQAREQQGNWIWFYLGMWWKHGRDYKSNPLEMEAHANENDMDYLTWRKPFAWRQYELPNRSS